MARPKKNIDIVKRNAEVKIVRDYFDIELNRKVNSGEILEVTVERMKQLKLAKVAELVCLKS